MESRIKFGYPPLSTLEGQQPPFAQLWTLGGEKGGGNGRDGRDRSTEVYELFWVKRKLTVGLFQCASGIPLTTEQ